MKVAPATVAYADAENRKLVVEFAIPGAPADTVVKSDKAEATYRTGTFDGYL